MPWAIDAGSQTMMNANGEPLNWFLVDGDELGRAC